MSACQNNTACARPIRSRNSAGGKATECDLSGSDWHDDCLPHPRPHGSSAGRCHECRDADPDIHHVPTGSDGRHDAFDCVRPDARQFRSPRVHHFLLAGSRRFAGNGCPRGNGLTTSFSRTSKGSPRTTITRVVSASSNLSNQYQIGHERRCLWGGDVEHDDSAVSLEADKCVGASIHCGVGRRSDAIRAGGRAHHLVRPACCGVSARVP